jgi:hypothetical protein
VGFVDDMDHSSFVIGIGIVLVGYVVGSNDMVRFGKHFDQAEQYVWYMGLHYHIVVAYYHFEVEVDT